MKYNFFYGLLMLFAITVTSCKKEFNDININPNAPATVAEAQLLASVESDLGFAQGGEMSRFSGLFTQQYNGAARQMQSYGEYDLTAENFDNLWRGMMYNGYLRNAVELDKLATTNGNKRYAGIAKMILAYGLATATDMWDKVPYTEAFKGVAVLQPKYDDQASIYTACNGLVDAAIVLLADAAPGGLVPGADDVIYGGSATKWTKFGHSLKARIALHQAKKDPSKYAVALGHASMGINSNAEEANYKFFNDPNGQAPMYQFLVSRVGDLSSGSFYNTLLTGLSDPRKAVFCAAFDDAHPYFTNEQKVPLISNAEMQFLKAECNQRAGASGQAAADAAYVAGIQSSFDRLGLPSTGYAPISATNVTLTDIMTQKYIALFGDSESFSDWRRTGIPALTSVTTGVAIPRRLLYPQSELSYNSNCPKGVATTDKVAWD